MVTIQRYVTLISVMLSINSIVAVWVSEPHTCEGSQNSVNIKSIEERRKKAKGFSNS